MRPNNRQRMRPVRQHLCGSVLSVITTPPAMGSGMTSALRSLTPQNLSWMVPFSAAIDIVSLRFFGITLTNDTICGGKLSVPKRRNRAIGADPIAMRTSSPTPISWPGDRSRHPTPRLFPIAAARSPVSTTPPVVHEISLAHGPGPLSRAASGSERARRAGVFWPRRSGQNSSVPTSDAPETDRPYAAMPGRIEARAIHPGSAAPDATTRLRGILSAGERRPRALDRTRWDTTPIS